MKRTLSAALLLLLLCAPPLQGAGLVTPVLSPPVSGNKLFDPDRLLTTAGVKYATGSDLTLEPELGIGYRATERDYSGVEELTHRVHAQAGWRVSLPQAFYLSAAAKLPVLTVDSAANHTGQDLGTSRYDFVRPFRNSLFWTGEMGIHLGSSTDLTLYYDQSPVSSLLAGGPQQEDRIGTRIILRFR